MHFADRVVIRAPRDRVWGFLLDPQRVAGCFPEVQRIEPLSPALVRATIPIRVAFLSLHVVVDVELVEQEAPERAAFRIHATGPGSTVDGRATFALSDSPGEDGSPGTLLDWSADVEPKGMAASVGQQTVERQAQPALQRAIECLSRSVEAR